MWTVKKCEYDNKMRYLQQLCMQKNMQLLKFLVRNAPEDLNLQQIATIFFFCGLIFVLNFVIYFIFWAKIIKNTLILFLNNKIYQNKNYLI